MPDVVFTDITSGIAVLVRLLYRQFHGHSGIGMV